MNFSALFLAVVALVIIVGSVTLARRIENPVLRLLAKVAGIVVGVLSISAGSLMFASPVWVARDAGAYLAPMFLVYLIGSAIVWLVRLKSRRPAWK